MLGNNSKIFSILLICSLLVNGFLTVSAQNEPTLSINMQDNFTGIFTSCNVYSNPCIFEYGKPFYVTTSVTFQDSEELYNSHIEVGLRDQNNEYSNWQPLLDIYPENEGIGVTWSDVYKVTSIQLSAGEWGIRFRGYHVSYGEIYSDEIPLTLVQPNQSIEIFRDTQIKEYYSDVVELPIEVDLGSRGYSLNNEKLEYKEEYADGSFSQWQELPNGIFESGSSNKVWNDIVDISFSDRGIYHVRARGYSNIPGKGEVYSNTIEIDYRFGLNVQLIDFIGKSNHTVQLSVSASGEGNLVDRYIEGKRISESWTQKQTFGSWGSSGNLYDTQFNINFNLEPGDWEFRARAYNADKSEQLYSQILSVKVENIIAHYDFENNGNNRFNTDNLFAVGSPIYSDGIIGQGVKVSSNGDYLWNYPMSQNTFNQLDEYTVTFWFKIPSQSSGDYDLVSLENRLFNFQLQDSTKIVMGIMDHRPDLHPNKDSDWTVLTAPYALDDNEWHFIAGSFDESLQEFKLCVDTLCQTKSVTRIDDGHLNVDQSPSYLRVGEGSLDIIIDELIIYDVSHDESFIYEKYQFYVDLPDEIRNYPSSVMHPIKTTVTKFDTSFATDKYILKGEGAGISITNNMISHNNVAHCYVGVFNYYGTIINLNFFIPSLQNGVSTFNFQIPAVFSEYGAPIYALGDGLWTLESLTLGKSYINLNLPNICDTTVTYSFDIQLNLQFNILNFNNIIDVAVFEDNDYLDTVDTSETNIEYYLEQAVTRNIAIDYQSGSVIVSNGLEKLLGIDFRFHRIGYWDPILTENDKTTKSTIEQQGITLDDLVDYSSNWIGHDFNNDVKPSRTNNGFDVLFGVTDEIGGGLQRDGIYLTDEYSKYIGGIVGFAGVADIFLEPIYSSVIYTQKTIVHEILHMIAAVHLEDSFTQTSPITDDRTVEAGQTMSSATEGFSSRIDYYWDQGILLIHPDTIHYYIDYGIFTAFNN